MSVKNKPAAAAAPATQAAAPSGDKPAKSGKLSKLAIGGFLAAVVVAETLVFFLMVPSGDEVAALAEARLIQQADIDHMMQHHHEDDEQRVVEFDLGSYGVSFIPAGSDRQHRVEFKLFGTLQAKDLDKMKQLFASREGRFRHQLILEIRNSSIDELLENQLGLIQRRILATSTELLGEAILLSVGFQDYQVIED